MHVAIAYSIINVFNMLLFRVWHLKLSAVNLYIKPPFIFVQTMIS